MQKNVNYTEINSKMWDDWALMGGDWSKAIDHEAFMKAKQGNFDVHLTACKPVPHDWFVPLKGAKVLGLASGGGQQCPVFAAQGAEVTVFDYSDQQLELEKRVAEREGYPIEIIKGDMSQRLPFEDDQFDMIFHPVSNCYIQEILPLWHECFRVLKKGGILLSGFVNPILYLFGRGEQELQAVNQLPYDGLKEQEGQSEGSIRKRWGIQFSHSLEAQIGGQLKAGFQLKDLYEDNHHRGNLTKYTPLYIATKAIKQ